MLWWKCFQRFYCGHGHRDEAPDSIASISAIKFKGTISTNISRSLTERMKPYRTQEHDRGSRGCHNRRVHPAVRDQAAYVPVEADRPVGKQRAETVGRAGADLHHCLLPRYRHPIAVLQSGLAGRSGPLVPGFR